MLVYHAALSRDASRNFYFRENILTRFLITLARFLLGRLDCFRVRHALQVSKNTKCMFTCFATNGLFRLEVLEMSHDTLPQFFRVLLVAVGDEIGRAHV